MRGWLRQELLAFSLVALAVPAGAPVLAATEHEMAEMRRLLAAMQAQNEELARRLAVLEAERARPTPRQAAPQRTEAPPALPRRADAGGAAPPVSTPATAMPAPASSSTARPSELEQRVRELELTRAAQENATRWVIQDALNKLGPRINEFLEVSGSLEVLAGRSRDPRGPVKDTLSLNTVELDFGIKLGEWVTGNLVLAYDSGSSVQFLTTEGTSAGVDRIAVDRATMTIGDVQRFPLFVKVGRDVLPFGTSTGVHKSDVLSISNPLTIDVFETRKTSVGIGFAFPTPAPGPSARPMVTPTVQPLLFAPLVSRGARWLGYQAPPQRPARATPVAPAATPPPFYGSLHAYEGSADLASNRKVTQNVAATLGYRTQGHCGRPYEESRSSLVCPWSFDFHVDYNTSVFDSAFLERGYRVFLGQIGLVPGMSASAKVNLGPFALVGEVNTALRRASFIDGVGRNLRIQPLTWQVSLGYQFDWNPWLDSIGGQGTFMAIGYSGSKDLAGANALVQGQPARVGAAPQSRIFVTLGEWILDGVKLQVEYNMNFDYGVAKGGTGKTGHGLFSVLTFNF